MKLNDTEITERIIARADLSKEEKKVARVFFKLSTAGPRTRKWVKALSYKKHEQLLLSLREKIYRSMNF